MLAKHKMLTNKHLGVLTDMNINSANNSHNLLSTQNNQETIQNKTANNRLSARSFKLGTVIISITSFLKGLKNTIKQKPITQFYFTLETNCIKPTGKVLQSIKSSDLHSLLSYNQMLAVTESSPEAYNHAKLDKKLKQASDIIDKFIQSEKPSTNTDELADKLFTKLKEPLDLMKDTKELSQVHPELTVSFKDKITAIISQKVEEQEIHLAIDEALDDLI